MQWKPYFLWELLSLTKIVGVTITSSSSDVGKEKEGINGLQVRAGTVKKGGECSTSSNGKTCDAWEDIEYCGDLNIKEKILPVREYSIICQKSIFARLIAVQILKSEQHMLTFNEISVIRESFFMKSEQSTLFNTIHGSPGT